jgi:hypothetical protein
VRFFNFNWNDAGAIGSCSHCFHPASTDSGARTVKMQNLVFDATVPKKLYYQWPFHAIYLDLDGSLTGKGPNTWATPYKKIHEQPECETLLDMYDGVTCDSTIQLRRLAFWSAKPNLNFEGMSMKVLRFDDSLLGPTAEDYEAYLLDRANYESIDFKTKADPAKSWTFPFVTGHKYKIHWGDSGIDYEQMTIDMSDRWEETDRNLYLVHNYTDVRAIMDVNVGTELLDNNTLPSMGIDDANFKTGQNIHLNDTAVRQLHFVINGKNLTDFPENKHIFLEGHRCNGSCMADITDVALESEKRYWSDPTNWPEGRLPEEGEEVHVEPGWDMIYDLDYPSPVYKLIRINGWVTFSDEFDTHLNAKHIFIRAGQLHIGSEEIPYTNTARITLHGEKNFEHIVYDNAIEAGNKLIANVGTIKMFGKHRTNHLTRLLAIAEKDATSITLEPFLDLVAGDRLAIAPTSYEPTASSEVFVATYDAATGATTLTNPISHYHWGAAESTALQFNMVDVRAEVMLLSRNIIIAGQDVETWGGQIVTSDTMEADLTFRTGQTILDHVEFYNCSQIDTMKAALRFEGASGSWSSVTNSAFHNGHGWGLAISRSANLYLADNIFYSFKPIGVSMLSVQNVTFHRNIVSHIYERTSITGENWADRRGGVAVCSLEENNVCRDLHITDNIVAGAAYAGFVMPGHDCGDKTQTKFRGNTAHSVHGFMGGMGAVIFPDPAS